MNWKKIIISITTLFLIVPIHAQQKIRIDIAADKPYAKIEPTMWGVFFEDINFSADGGIYAELVKNRSLEF
jgi:hypothetical protein